MSYRILFIIFFSMPLGFIDAQILVEGYIYESGNRGYINEATVSLTDENDIQIFGKTTSDKTGKYEIQLENEGRYRLSIEKPPFIDFTETINISKNALGRVFLQHEINRSPGYVFEMTLAEKNPDSSAVKGALKGALIEVYNNTKKREHLVIENLQDPDFKINLIKGNHYTILVRKDGFLAKRMEAFVDVEGCILCFEGVGEITPGVSDILTESNTMGTLLANVELDRYFEGKVIGLNNIYYELNKSKLTPEAKQELDKVARFIKDNPDISVELGSHTDSRGKSDYNQSLSQRRAKSAVDYLVTEKNTPKERILFKGYGESKLTNDCGDNSKCSDEEHAANRRTELTIINIGGDYVFRSLRQMKADELLGEILADISAEGQIRIPQDGELPIESNFDATINLQEKSAEVNIEEAVVLKEKDISINQEVENKSNETKIKEISRVENSESEKKIAINSPKKEESNIENWMAQQAIPIDTTSVEKVEHYDNKDKIAFNDGYKIVILFSRYELPDDHPLFERFPRMKVYSTADANRLYMIENFKSKKEALRRIEKRYKSSYPSAYVVGFKDGIIVD